MEGFRAALIAALVVCFAHGHSSSSTSTAPDTAATDERRSAGALDSLELYEEILSRGATTDEAEAAILAGELAGGDSRRPPAAGPRRSYFLSLERVVGYRDAVLLDAGWRSGVVGTRRVGAASVAPYGRIGARRDRGKVGGFIELGGWGPVARFVAGGIRPRFGEGLLLGVRSLPFASPRPTGIGARANAPTPTSSIWGRRLGAALTVRAGATQSTVTGWREPDGTRVWWVMTSRRTPSGTVAVAAGTRPGEPVGWGRVDASVFLERSVGELALAGEVASFRGRAYGAVHAVVEAAGRWNAVVFAAPSPSGASAGLAAAGDEFRGRSGGALHRNGRWGGVATRVSVYGSVKRTSQSIVERRRLDATARGRAGGGGSWGVSARLDAETESEFPDDAIEHHPRRSRRREAHLRGSWTDAADGPFRQRYRLTLRVDDGREFGVVGTVAWKVVYSVFEAGCQVNNYAIAAGHTGYVVQSGLTGGEALTAVSRNGSDVSSHVRVTVRGLRAQLYASRPWGRPVRWYASLRLSL